MSHGSESATTAHGVVGLGVIADELQEAAGASPARRAARTLPVPPGGGLRQTVLALVAGARLQEHESPGGATLQVLRGRVRLAADPDRWELGELDLLAIPARRHGLEALTDTVVLLTVATGARP